MGFFSPDNTDFEAELDEAINEREKRYESVGTPGEADNPISVTISNDYDASEDTLAKVFNFLGYVNIVCGFIVAFLDNKVEVVDRYGNTHTEVDVEHVIEWILIGIFSGMMSFAMARFVAALRKYLKS